MTLEQYFQARQAALDEYKKKAEELRQEFQSSKEETVEVEEVQPASVEA